MKLRGFYAVLDRDDPELARKLVGAGGAKILQVRLKPGTADEQLRLAPEADPGGGAGQDHVAGLERRELRDHADQGGDGDHDVGDALLLERGGEGHPKPRLMRDPVRLGTVGPPRAGLFHQRVGDGAMPDALDGVRTVPQEPAGTVASDRDLYAGTPSEAVR